MNAQDYREQKLKEMDGYTLKIRPAITAAFPALFELARILQEIDFRQATRIETPFGDYIFSPVNKVLEDLENN